MSISGSPEDEYDIITLQYTEEGLLSIDENRNGHAAAFGDDIAIESLATEFRREVYMCVTGWCGAGADHYEPLIANPLPLISQDKAAVVL
ncbi:hypothetical protein BHE74_00022567 [Ensete ventricosum]|nr:hypothetical protein BHE74_00022567 [Ensete ventricosum]RZR97135.1 hypothetical protein BHM03_00026303 [Ensete ventricosum]